jgi:hypothetical protein
MEGRMFRLAHDAEKENDMLTMLKAETHRDLLIDAPDTTSAPDSKARRWIGRVMTGLPVLFLIFDCVLKFVRPPMVVAGNAQLGYPPDVIVGLGVVLAICVALYVIPRTSIIGAVLLTGYLGGAIASHVRVGDPLFSHVLFPTYVAAFVWGGLYLRDRRLRALFDRPVRV